LARNQIESDEGFKSVYNSGYIRFLHMVEFPLSWKNTQQIRAFQKEKDFNGIIELKLNTFKNEFAESQYETMLSRYLIWAMDRKSHAEVIDKHVEGFLLDAQNPMYTKAVTNKYAELIGDVDLDTEGLAKKLMDIPIHAGNILPDILSKYKNKVIVLDFWGTWCGPCISEFRNGYPELIPKYENEQITFVFLASKSPENLWKKMGPRTLFSRQCGECQATIQTTFATDFPDNVLCEGCYIKAIN